MLGKGGQGVVYLSERRGADNFTLPVALKFFSPERFPDERSYREAMERMAQVSSRVALIQHDNLLDVQNFIERRRIRVLEMEWVDGYDLDSLLAPEMLERAQGPRRAEAVGLHQQRDRHSGAEPHSAQAGHGRGHHSRVSGRAGGAASRRNRARRHQAVEHHDQANRQREDHRHRLGARSQQHAAAEDLHAAVRGAGDARPRGSHAAVGPGERRATCWSSCWPAGRCLPSIRDYATLLEKKRTLPQWLHKVLPPEVRHSELLMTICRRLTAPDPMLRYATAEQADTGSEGLAEFQRTLVRGDLASEYENELRVWLEELD